MFKSKIMTRSQEEIKIYFKTYVQDIESKGFKDPERHKESRQKRIQEEMRSVGSPAKRAVAKVRRVQKKAEESGPPNA